jgi:UDP-N-acetylmuramoylalanine--D-glutamate ligase
VLIGRDAQLIADKVADSVESEFADSLEEAVSICRERAVAGDAVLLSPACASQDMFKDFAHRGRVYVATVEGLQ